MGLFPKDRNLAIPLERLQLEVRASDYGLTKRELEVRLDAFLTSFEEPLAPYKASTAIQSSSP